jgi:cbb3-type cytochrome oxidase maturation protein
MDSMWWLILIALGMGLAGLAAFLWSLRHGQYEDLDGAAERILLDEDPEGWLRRQGRLSYRRGSDSI